MSSLATLKYLLKANYPYHFNFKMCQIQCSLEEAKYLSCFLEETINLTSYFVETVAHFISLGSNDSPVG